jgi:hypothetical protein
MPAASVGLDRPFDSLWAEETWLPAPIINGTSEKQDVELLPVIFGSRTIGLSMRYIISLNKSNPYFDITVSTEAHNSPRFPYI